jgi:hypothetical protein
MKSIAKLLPAGLDRPTQAEHEQQRGRCRSQPGSGMLFLGATSFFEFANPQLDSARNFSRVRTTRGFRPLELRLFRFLISAFDNSDPRIHDLSPLLIVNGLIACQITGQPQN